MLNKKEKELSEQTRRKVLEAIQRLGYSPNQHARGLKKGKTNLIGFIIPDQNPFFMEILKGIHETCAEYDWQVIVACSEENEVRQNELVDIFISQQVSGIILVPVTSTLAGKDKWSNFPIVLLDREIEDSPFPSVSATNIEGCCQATERLAMNGHQRIGIILASPDISTTVQRRKGYEQALHAHGLRIEPDLITYGGEYGGTQSQINGGYRSTMHLLNLPQPATAIIAINHLLMLGALKAMKEMKVRVPDDVAFIGFDDHPWSEINTPQLTVVSQPAYDMGRQSIHILRALDEDKTARSIKLPMKLIIRESCGTATMM